jgi:amidase
MTPESMAVFRDAAGRLASRGLRAFQEHVVADSTPPAFAFRPELSPVCRLSPGDIVELTTADASNGTIRSPEDLPSRAAPRPMVNPLVGPLYIEGAEVGDTVVVETLSLTPLLPRVFSWIRSYSGALSATSSTALLNPPLPETVWAYDVDHSSVVFHSRNNDLKVRLPYEPFLGTVGCAQPEETPHSTVPGRHGGNMDAVENGIGSCLYLPALVPGALLYVGDAHARQGDGELCGTAVEMSARARLRIDLIKGRSVRWPMIENAEHIMAVGAARPLEDAYRIACKEIVEWLQAEQGFELLDAYQLSSQALTCRIANVVNRFYTVVARFPKLLVR